ncbi:MAG TPA: hypothetical protein VGR95_17245 [Thermoanaerobaculia bacterium]|nr:hypothetical protein [Thermoanaerobaculia bacterium]
MRRILILDRNHALRAQMIDALQRAANVEVVVVDTDVELISRIYYGIYAAVFADDDLLNDRIDEVVEAVRSAIARPMLIVASNETHRDLDADLVTLIVRKPYDVPMVTGILLSAVLGVPGGSGAAEGDSTLRTK